MLRLSILLLITIQVFYSCTEEYVPTYEITDLDNSVILGDYLGNLSLTYNDTIYRLDSVAATISLIDSSTFSLSFDSLNLSDTAWTVTREYPYYLVYHKPVLSFDSIYVIPDLFFTLDQYEFYEHDQRAELVFLPGQDFYGDPIAYIETNHLGTLTIIPSSIRVWSIYEPFVIILQIGLTNSMENDGLVTHISFSSERNF